jgi:acyl-CoA reductase-like NAD-dependent aldehyde dehydrogenase
VGGGVGAGDHAAAAAGVVRRARVALGFGRFRVYDAAGEALLDCYNNVPSVGHAHPRVVAALADQSALLNTHTRYLHEHVVTLGERLGSMLPGELGVCFFVCSGTEANDLAVEIAVEQYDNAGQVCLSGTRILVHESIADAFADKFREKAAALKQGDPRDPTTDIGPQVHQVHFDRIKGFVDRAAAAGQNIVWGGGPNEELGGLYFKPTLVRNPEPGSEIVTSEIFGPVLAMQTFQSDDEVIAMANGTEFGLAAVVVSGNREHAQRITSELVAGTIWVNCFFVRDLRAPFGGSKKSGIGRDGGTWSFDFYADVKNTVISPNGWKE